jgi:hypothetical protein
MSNATSDLEQIDDWFSYHAPTRYQMTLLDESRRRFKSLATWLVQNVEPSRERSIALTDLRTAAMLFNQAIIWDRTTE